MRRLVLLALALVIALGALPLRAEPAAAASYPLQQLASEVYFSQTGHHVRGDFLRYWWTRGGLDIFGFPLTEELTINGRTVQYFERARFEHHPENPDKFKVLLTLAGNEVVRGRTEAAFKPYPADLKVENTPDRRFFPETGHTLAYGFKAFWEKNGGLEIFGYPISEEFTEGGYTVQYFERARFEYHPEHRGTRYEVQLGLLGTQLAERDRVDRAPVTQRGGTPVWPQGMFLPAKWIEINLSVPSRLTAWEGNTPVFSTTISGGTSRTPTPTGIFHIQYKLRYDDMRGVTPGVGPYYLPDVPYVMYFYTGGYAIHGTYWHANFGYPMSNGCVNMRTADAAWLYNWAPNGTPIWIHW